MAKYYFHIQDGVSIHDDTGTELPNLHEAQKEALRYAGELIADNATKRRLSEDWAMKVQDEAGATVFELTLHATETEKILSAEINSVTDHSSQ